MDINSTKNRRALHRKLFGLMACLMLYFSGCAVGPDYDQVQPQSPQQWSARMENGLKPVRPAAEALSAWWDVFDDPVLTALEKKAAEGNLDLKTAFSRLRQARLRRGISRAALFPAVDAAGLLEKQRSSQSMNPMRSEYAGLDWENELYMLSFDSAWELDIFGGLRRSVEAAQAELEAGRAGLQDVLISIMAEVALNYIEARTYQRRLDITRQNLETQNKSYDLNRSRYQAGLIDELAVQQSLRNLERTRSLIPRLKSGLTAAKNRLAVLVGLSPGALEAELTPGAPIPVAPLEVAVGIPAEAMRRRPDIRRAERSLAAQTARIGVAAAELYPKFRLAGTIGLKAIDEENYFFDAQSRFWNIGPGVSWNIFHGGELRLNIKLQTEKQKEALIQYKSAVLRAQEEIENALTDYAKEQMREQSLEKAVAAARRVEWLARDRYKAGLVDFYNVLDAQKSLLELEDELVQSRGQVASTLAGLYKALGGGWEYYTALIKKAGGTPKKRQ